MDQYFNSSQANKFISKILDKIMKNISDELKHIIQNRIVEYTVENARRCSHLRTILHKDSILIDKIYYPIMIKYERMIVIENKDSSKKNNRIIYEKTEISIKEAKDLFKENSKIVLQGNGGSGKTTLIKYLYINTVKSGFKIPILLNLRDFNFIDLSENKKKKEIINNIFYKEIVSHLLFNKLGVDSEFVIRMFDSGEFLFILDGYDELRYDIKSYILKDIEDFIIRFPQNKFIITSRPYTDVTRLTNFSLYEISGIEEFEIEKFINLQLFNNPELAKSISESLQLQSSKKYLPLLSNPLFIVLFINSFESYPKLPPQKSTFYWQVFDALYEKHETFSKGGYQRPKLSELKREKFEFVLNSFSFVSYFQNRFDFDQIYMEKTIREIKKNYSIDFDLTHFIEDLKVTISILIEDGTSLSFIHRTIQEYFTARFISVLNENAKRDFFKELSLKQSKYLNHTFLIELISELYPNEYSQFYIYEQIKSFFDVYDIIFLRSDPGFNVYVKAIESFQNLKNIISASKDFTAFFDLFIQNYELKTNQLSEQVKRFLFMMSDQKQKYLANQILILYQNWEVFNKKVEEYLLKIGDSNKPFIEFAFNPKNIQ